MKLVTKLKKKAQFPYFVKPTLIYVNIKINYWSCIELKGNDKDIH